MTSEIKLSGKHGGTALVDDADLPIIAGHRWHSNMNSRGKLYARTTVSKGKFVWMHRMILSAPNGAMVDHIDFNGLNNTRSNLRLCSIAENNRHVKFPAGQSGFRGVQFTARSASGRHWRATIKLHGKVVASAHFQFPVDAAREYDRLARIHHGEFAVLNFPETPAGTV